MKNKCLSCAHHERNWNDTKEVEILTVNSSIELFTCQLCGKWVNVVTGKGSFAKGWVLLSGILNSILYHKKLYP